MGEWVLYSNTKPETNNPHASLPNNNNKTKQNPSCLWIQKLLHKMSRLHVECAFCAGQVSTPKLIWNDLIIDFNGHAEKKIRGTGSCGYFAFI